MRCKLGYRGVGASPQSRIGLFDQYGSQQTLVSYRCSLGFTVYRLHCGFLELFPYNALGQVCPCTSRKPKSDKLLKSLGVVWKTSPSGEPECIGIFRRQTIWLRPWGYLQQVRRLQKPPGEVYPDNPCGFSTGCLKLLKRRRGCLEKLGRSLRVCLYYYCFPDHNHKTFQQFARLWFPRGAGTFTPRAHSGKKLKKAAMESVHCK